MAVTQYIVTDFNKDRAAQGSLCAMVLTGVSGESGGTEVPGTFEINPLKGVGICQVEGSSFILVIDSIRYTFTDQGNALSSGADGYKLLMAKAVDEPTEIGNAVETNVINTIDRGTRGHLSYDEEELEESSSIIISGLEARDQFAVHALRTLMQRMSKDPVSVSDNEKMFVCEAAYKWAANMMTQASKVRAEIVTEAGGGTETTDAITRGMAVDNSDITSTSDKLLNNIVAALEKTDEKEVVGANTIFYERVSIPKLMEWLTAYSHHTSTGAGDTQTTVGLDDLINAVKVLGTNSGHVEITSMPSINIGDSGIGRDSSHPIYISGGGFPNKDSLAAAITGALMDSVVSFNSSGAVGYTTKAELKGAMLGYLNSYADLASLAAAIYSSIQSSIDSRIQAWLNAARVTVNGVDYTITVNTPT